MMIIRRSVVRKLRGAPAYGAALRSEGVFLLKIPGWRSRLRRSGAQDEGFLVTNWTFAHRRDGIGMAARGMSINAGDIGPQRGTRNGFPQRCKRRPGVAPTASFERGGWTALAVNRRFVSCRSSWRARRRRPMPSPDPVRPPSASSPSRPS